MLLVLVAIQTVFVLGIGPHAERLQRVLSVDVKHFIGISLQALFYSAPIVYPIKFVEDAASRTSFSAAAGVHAEPARPAFVDAYRGRAVRPAVPGVLGRPPTSTVWGVSRCWHSVLFRVPSPGSTTRGGSCERRHRRRRRLEAVPACITSANQSLKAAGHGAVPRVKYEEFWAFAGRVARGARRERRNAFIGENGSGQEHPAQVHGPTSSGPEKGPHRDARQDSPRCSSSAPAFHPEADRTGETSS